MEKVPYKVGDILLSTNPKYHVDGEIVKIYTYTAKPFIGKEVIVLRGVKYKNLEWPNFRGQLDENGYILKV